MFSRLTRLFTATVTRDKLIISYSRSQGPGGQNVNKVNSKADVRFHVDSADWISPEAKERLKALFSHFINKEGELDQKSNEEAAIEKIQVMVNKAYEEKKERNIKEYKESDYKKVKRVEVKRSRGERASFKKGKFSDYEKDNRFE